jgi:hypothetical protein
MYDKEPGLKHPLNRLKVALLVLLTIRTIYV